MAYFLGVIHGQKASGTVRKLEKSPFIIGNSTVNDHFQ
jgi:hypothetical protein